MIRFFAVLFLCGSSAFAQQQDDAFEQDFWISKQFQASQRSELGEVLVALRDLKIEGPAFKTFNALADADPKNGMLPWLKERIRFLYAQDQLDFTKDVVLERGIRPDVWDYRGIYSRTEILNWLIPFKDDKESGGIIGAMNVGAAVALHSQSKGRLLSLRLRGIYSNQHPRIQDLPTQEDVEGGRLIIKSPRVGVMVLGAAFFFGEKQLSEIFQLPETMSKRTLQIMRESILIHEARHSDGSGEEIGFVHIHCPPGHQRAGLAGGCDFNLNGPYTLQAEYVEARMNSCGDCTKKEKADLEVIAKDLRSRVIKELDFGHFSELKTSLSQEIEEAIPERTDLFVMKSRDTVLKELQEKIKISNGVLKATEWKSSPEPI